MPYSPKDLGIFLSLNLRAASCTCCHGEEKKGNWLEVSGMLKLCLICFNLAFSELLCESAGKLTLEV